MTPRTSILALALVGLAAIYLFVSAPEKLPETAGGGSAAVPVEKLFKVLAQQNDAARSLYTTEIVAAGQRAGLRFGEVWKRDGEDEGPLPALFLREAATSVQKTDVPLGLFLGSDFPISPSNKFNGRQGVAFEEVKKTRQAVFFRSEDTGAHTAMFPDFSSAPGCVSCHNEHLDSPKTDWKLNDVMGATTWTYPRSQVSSAEFAAAVLALRAGVKEAYEAYLRKAATMKRPPEVGTKWPREGYFLPSVEVFLAEFDRRGGGGALTGVLDALQGAGAKVKSP